MGDLEYGLIRRRIYDSSIASDWQARYILMDLIVLAGPDDCVRMNRDALLHRLRCPPEILDHALEALQKPDPKSRSLTHEGRRIVLINPENENEGYFVVNRDKYKRQQAEDRKAYKAKKAVEYRAKKKYSDPENLHNSDAAEALEDFRR